MEIDERIVFIRYNEMLIMLDQRCDPPFIKAEYDNKEISIKCNGDLRWRDAKFSQEKEQELRDWIVDHLDDILNKRFRER